MTILEASSTPRRLAASVRAVRRILPMAGCAVPAEALRDPTVAAWVRNHGVAVTVCGRDELEAVLSLGLRPVQIMLRCDRAVGTIWHGAGLGVSRFVVSTDRHVDALTACGGAAKFVYLDEQGPAVLGERRLDIVGVHCDIQQPERAEQWAAAVDRLLARVALMRSWGSVLTRISLAGGPAATWLSGGTGDLGAVASVINDALDDGCARWRLPRPAVTLAPRDA